MSLRQDLEVLKNKSKELKKDMEDITAILNEFLDEVDKFEEDLINYRAKCYSKEFKNVNHYL